MQICKSGVGVANGYMNIYYCLVTFELWEKKTGSRIDINETGITWPDDKGKKFKRAEKWEEIRWIDVENGG